MKVLNLEQDTPEWHELRRKSIGASDCSIIMGNNPWKTESDLFQEKMGLSKQPETLAMRRGKELEPIALATLSEELSIPFKPAVIQSEEYPWQIASLDGLNHEERLIIEIKCSQKLCEQAKEGIIPQYYRDQMQHQLCVTGLYMCYYYAYWDGEGHWIKMRRDDEYITKIIEKETEFYRRMLEFDPPEPDYIFRDDPQWGLLAYEYDQYDIEIKRLTKLKEEAKKGLVSISDSKNTKGSGLTLTKVIRPGVVNSKAVYEDYMVDVEKYRSEAIEYWTVTKEKI